MTKPRFTYSNFILKFTKSMLLKIPKWLTKLLIPAIAGLILYLTTTTLGVNATISPLPKLPSSITNLQAAGHPNHEQINSIARTTTVFIIPTDVTQQRFEEVVNKGQMFQAAGSGTLVAKKGLTYYVLTNQHVAPDRTNYVIRTYDGEIHRVNSDRPGYKGQEDTTATIITRFGQYNKNKRSVDGYDLALMQFESDKDYPIVPIGDSSRLSEGDFLFVSGWPYEKSAVKRVRVFRDGRLKTMINPADPNGNYSICYIAETAPGMSGGPVLNEQGEMIGIHGRGKQYQSPYQSCIDTSWAIQVNDFINEQEKKEHYRLSNHFNRPPVNFSEFTQIVQNEANADSLKQQVDKFNDLIIAPGDPAYEATKNIIDKYDGCMKPLLDGTWRLGRYATRGEFVVDINGCLDTVTNLLSGSQQEAISRSDFESVEETVVNLAWELDFLLPGFLR